MNALFERDLVLGTSPFAEPNAALVIAVGRAGGLGVLDLGRDATVARAELDLVVRRLRRPFGVRLVEPCPVPLPELVDTVVVDLESFVPQRVDLGERRVLAEVTSVAEARAAVEYGVDGVIANVILLGELVNRNHQLVFVFAGFAGAAGILPAYAYMMVATAFSAPARP